MRIYWLYALLLISYANTIAQERKVSLLFAGDAMMHTPQIHAAKKDSGYNYHAVFQHIQHKIAKTDIAGINLETTFGGTPYTGYPLFSSPQEYATALHAAGFNLFFTANNHALDTGPKGLKRTIRVVKEVGAKQTGTFISPHQRALHYPLMIVKNGIRIAFLNYTYGTNGLEAKAPTSVNLIDTLLIKKDIAAAQLLKPDIIIAVMHWGNEYQTQPSVQQESLSQFLIRHQVRIIIGHHPHVVQPIHTYTASDSITHTVFYSLGNFVSNQRKPLTDGGMLAHIVLSKPDNDTPIDIESVNYSLVWVHKYFLNNKPVYRLLPVQTDTMGYNLQPADEWAMNRFVKGVEKIMEK